jgi:hypothetical protein
VRETERGRKERDREKGEGNRKGKEHGIKRKGNEKK